MGTEVAVRRGVGTVVLDVRRGDGPKPCFNYLAAVYGAILLMLVLIVAAAPYTKTDTANSRIEHGFSAATIADPRN